MSLIAEAPLVSVLIWPVDSAPHSRTQWTLSENFAGSFQPGGDSDESDADIPGFTSLQFPNQPAFINLQGKLTFVRFTSAGRVERGVSAALQSNPETELCGITIGLRYEPLQNRLAKEPDGTKSPELLDNAPDLLWRAESGLWETVVPATTPLESNVRPQAIPPDTACKIRTDSKWDANRGFVAVLTLGGVTYKHKSDPAVRLIWGDKWSLVFRGQGSTARPSLERRVSGGNWECVRVLRDCRPLDQEFWNSSHTVTVQRIGARLCVEVDGVEFGIVETQQQNGVPAEVTWPQAPLRLSVWGAEAMLRVHRLTGDSTKTDGKGKAVPLQVSFTRHLPAPDIPPFGKESLKFAAHGNDITYEDQNVFAEDGTGSVGSLSIKTRMQGTGLDNVTIKGSWSGTLASYDTLLQCTATTPPLLCGLVSEFAPRPLSAAPDAIELRPALSSLSVDSGDPESLPDAEASFSLSYPLLQRLIPKWQEVIQPYRPVLIRAKYAEQDKWTTLFRGYLTPDSTSRGGWNDRQMPLVARGPLLRLSQPAALIDERFGPLDLQIPPETNQLYGAQAARMLLAIELGNAWVENFNCTGDPLRFLPDGHPPLLDHTTQGLGLFDATQVPQSGSWRLPPPFGQDIKSWIDSLAKYDYAVWFFDPADNAFYYGRFLEFLVTRGKTRWDVPETAPPATVTTTRDWPLLSSLSQNGLLDNAPNDVRVWGTTPKSSEGLSPSFVMGRAGDSNPASLDPLSIAQSWRRTHLEKPSFLSEGVGGTDYANELAYNIWHTLRGRPPVRMDAEFETGFLGPRWGELLHLPTGFDGPAPPDKPLATDGAPQDWRILRVKHTFNFNGDQNRFSTTLNTRSLSADGQ